MSGLRLGLLGLLAGLSAACGYGAISAEGSFGPQRFTPTGTVFAVIDSTTVTRDETGAVQVEPRSVPDLTLFMCEAALDPDVDWQGLAGSEIIELRETVRRSDRVWLRNFDAGQIVAGSRLLADYEHNDFSAVVLQGTETIGPESSYAELRPLGRVVTLALSVEEIDAREGGHLRGQLTLNRTAASDQPANTATGSVVLRFDAPIVGERIGESNLAVIEP